MGFWNVPRNPPPDGMMEKIMIEVASLKQESMKQKNVCGNCELIHNKISSLKNHRKKKHVQIRNLITVI